MSENPKRNNIERPEERFRILVDGVEDYAIFVLQHHFAKPVDLDLLRKLLADAKPVRNGAPIRP